MLVEEWRLPVVVASRGVPAWTFELLHSRSTGASHHFRLVLRLGCLRYRLLGFEAPRRLLCHI